MCFTNLVGQVSERTYGKGKIRKLNQEMKLCKQSVNSGLLCSPLQKDSLHIRFYSDSGLVTKNFLSSQIGYIILLCDDTNMCHVLDYSIKKYKRIVSSNMASEV